LGRLDGEIAPVGDVSVGDVAREVVIAASPGGLLERGGCLEALEASWADAVDGRGRLVLVASQAGGKTALVREFCQRVPPQRRVLSVGCDGLRTPRPLAPFADIAASASDGFAETNARGEPSARCFAVLIGEPAAVAPTILVIEDLHWADGATLDVMTMPGRRAAARACPPDCDLQGRRGPPTAVGAGRAADRARGALELAVAAQLVVSEKTVDHHVSAVPAQARRAHMR
jgi:hypothetical protein